MMYKDGKWQEVTPSALSEAAARPVRKSPFDNLPPEVIWAILIAAAPLILLMRQVKNSLERSAHKRNMSDHWKKDSSAG